MGRRTAWMFGRTPVLKECRVIETRKLELNVLDEFIFSIQIGRGNTSEPSR